MKSRIELEAEYQKALTESAVSEVLKQLGLDSGVRSFNDCRRVYGKWFVDHVKSGALAGAKEGNRIMYRISDINALRAAELRLAAKRAATIEPRII